MREDGMSDSGAEGTPALPAALGAAEPSVGPLRLPWEAAPVCRETLVFIALGAKFTACCNLNLQRLHWECLALEPAFFPVFHTRPELFKQVGCWFQ